MTSEERSRTVVLRNERSGADSRHLEAYTDSLGLHIAGQDLGPGTASVSDDGEYEWESIYAWEQVPMIVSLLGGDDGADIMSVLDGWVGRSYDLERILREGDVPRRIFIF